MVPSPKMLHTGDFTPISNEPQSKVGVHTPTYGNPQSPLKIDVGLPSIVLDDAYLLGTGITQD